ncbi:MAG: aspartate aminotransferase family protein [Thermoplasmata archaeon]
MSDFQEEYVLRHPSSQKFFEEASAVTPGGVSHNLRFFPPYPLFVESASGNRLRDVDGNEYVDYWMGHFALLLGHNPPPVVEALKDQLEHGLQWGIANPLEVRLAERVQRHVPCAEAVRFCNTGAEATMYAVRTARGYTGRTKVLKATGGWHGYSTDLLGAIHPPFEAPESLGLPAPFEARVGTFPFNDPEGAASAIQREKDLAAVIVEPVLGAGGGIPPEPGFLQALREETEAKDALLIFDEIITGFRLGLGGAQAHYGVTPDMVTLGKILGGGLPVGAIAGKEEVMRWTSVTGPERDGLRVAVGGGTFSCNPMSMRAGLATLEYLEAHQDGYEGIGRMGEALREQAREVLASQGVPAVVAGVASLFQIHFLKEETNALQSAEDVHRYTIPSRATEEFKVRMLNEGVHTMHGGGCLSFVHSGADVRGFLEALSVAAGAMRGVAA